MYYLKKNEKVFGPFTLEKLQDMVAENKILSEDFISEDRSTWAAADSIKELFPELVTPEENNIDEFNFLSIFWNPVYALPIICEKYEKSKLNWISVLYIFLSTLFLLLATLFSGIVHTNFKNILISVLISIIPCLTMLVFLLILKKMFSSEKQGKGKEILLISGLVFFPACLSMLIVSLINMSSVLSAFQIIVLLAGLGIYAFAYSVLLLFNACTRLLGIRGSATVFVVSTLLLVSVGITGFFMKLL